MVLFEKYIGNISYIKQIKEVHMEKSVNVNLKITRTQFVPNIKTIYGEQLYLLNVPYVPWNSYERG